MLKFVEAAQLRSEHAANRALIRCGVGMSADDAVDGAGIQTGAAANAMQDFAFFGVGQQFAAAVVQKHDVKLVRAADLVGLSRPADQRVVTSDVLARP